MTKDLIYPHFFKCVRFTDDLFWKSVFEDLAFGATPYGTFISKNHIQSNYKGREFVYKIKPDDDPKTIFNDITHIFSTKMKMISPSDMESSKRHIDDENDEKVEGWSSIKKKSIKDVIIVNYIIEMGKKNNLPKKAVKKLMDIIILFMTLKIITSADIVYKDGNIVNINGLTFCEQTGTFKFDRDLECGSSSIEMYRDDKDMISEWCKFIAGLEKSKFVVDKV